MRMPGEDIDSHHSVCHVLGLPIIDLLDNPIDIHKIIVRGLPNKSLISLLDKTGLSAENMAPAIGVSARTYQRLVDRRKDALLSTEQSSRLWLLADFYVRAHYVLGTSALAIDWLCSPAISLNGYKPIALMTTYPGSQVVSLTLGRLDGCVYT